MEKLYGVLWNVTRFITDQNYQWKQGWVRKLAKKCSIIHENIWTGMRVPGMLLVIWADQLFRNSWLTLGLFIIFGLTDWIDGKVVLAKSEKGTKFGSVFDGVVDRIFIISLIYYFGIYKSGILNPKLFYLLCLIEGAAYLILWLIEIMGVIKDKANFYEHLNLGKYKFGIEISLGIVLWLGSNFFTDWMWWRYIANMIISTAIVFAFFAVACKINKNLMVYFADVLTLTNAACGIMAILLAKTNMAFAAMLVISGAVIDFFDGYIARRTKLGRGLNAFLGTFWDSVADFITFGIAPAVMVLSVGVDEKVAILYVATTFIRLVRFIWRKRKISFISQKKQEGVRKLEEFEGYPSTAAGIAIANLAWCQISSQYLTLAVITLAIFEVSFSFKWYHFKNFPRLKKKVKLVPALAMITALILEKFNLGIVVLVLLYTSIFFKPLSVPFFLRSE